MARSPFLQSSLRSMRLRAACLVFACAGIAEAQLHWDTSADVGVEKRFLRARPADRNDAGFGPFVRAGAHVALLPLVRVGVYAAGSYSPVRGASDRAFAGGGLEFRLIPPVRFPPWIAHAYLYTGFGYSAVWATPKGGTALRGGCFDLPVGFAATHRIRKPVEIGLALGTRFSIACNGSVFAEPQLSAGPLAPAPEYLGRDIFALTASALLNVEL
jgi:hypothetical protein